MIVMLYYIVFLTHKISCMLHMNIIYNEKKNKKKTITYVIRIIFKEKKIV